MRLADAAGAGVAVRVSASTGVHVGVAEGLGIAGR
jgi:hypothetical protein